MMSCGSAFLLSSLALVPAGLLAQGTPQPDAATAFANEPYVIESDSTVVSMKADATGTRVQTYAIRIQSESALRSFGVVAIAYPHSSEAADFSYVRVRHADGTVQETPVTDAMDQPAPVTREAPSYSDLQIKQLPVKNLRIGDTLEWQTRSTVLHPEVPGQFWSQSYATEGAVILSETLELHTPLATHVNLWTNPRGKVTFSETTSGDERIARWSHSDLRPTVGAAAEAAKLAEEKRPRTPDEELDIKEGKLPTFAWTTFPDWAAVGAWYRDLSVSRATPDAAIKARVAELTAGKPTDLEKAQALYAYVSSQIRYIGVSFGIGRYQPHTAAEVLANQYGDCKDKHTLLAAMLAAAGLHADPTLIGAGIRFNPAVPSPAAFNHLITHLTLAGQPVWLDSTAEVSPWRALVATIRDHQALVIPATAVPSIERTPADLPYASFSTSVVSGSLDPSLNSDSQIVLTFHDDSEIVLRSVLRSVSPADYGTFVQNLMANLGFGGTTSEPSLEHLADPSQPFSIRFHYHRTRDSSWGENRITATFQPISLPGFSPDKPPVAAIQLGTPRTDTSTVAVTLPENWTVDLPEPVHAHTDFATCDVTFHLEKGKLLEERKLVVLKKEVPASDFKAYQSWYETAGISGVPFIQLTPPTKATAASSHTAPAPPASGTSVHPSDPHAAELVVSAGEKIRAMDPDAARTLLDQAKAINPTERGLWLGYAGVASQFGASSEAIDNMKRELTYFPDEVRLYPYIGQEQMRLGDPDAALATFRAWAAAAPSNPVAFVTLVYALDHQKQDAEAITVGHSALDRLSKAGTEPKDLIELRLATASAQAHSGDKAGAAAAVQPLLATVTEPMQVNSVTYTLAEGNLDLAAAEAAQRKAVASLEAKTTGWSLTEAPPLVNRDLDFIAATWDTLGWILYREGRYPEALSYIEPAASVLDHQDVRDHLAALASALKRPSLAHTNFQKLRTISLGSAHGRYGTAELRLLLKDGSTVETGPYGPENRPVLGSAKLGSAESAGLVKAADLHQLLPPGSSAHLLRGGIVNCFGSVCQLLLIPLGN